MQASDDPIVEQPGGLRRIGRVPEVGQHGHAAVLDLGRLRVLVLVDHVLGQAFGHEPAHLGLHPVGHERGQVLAGVAVEHQLVVDDLVGRGRRHLAVGQSPRGNRASTAPWAKSGLTDRFSACGRRRWLEPNMVLTSSCLNAIAAALLGAAPTCGPVSAQREAKPACSG